MFAGRWFRVWETPREKLMELQTYGMRRYPATSSLMASSFGLGWSTMSAELRAHGPSEMLSVVPQYVEICLVVAGNGNSRVRRTSAGIDQDEAAGTGTIWLSPAGLGKELSISGPIPETMHIYLPTAPFDRLKDDFNLPDAPSNLICLAAAIHDDVIEQLGRSIRTELVRESAAGRMYVETAALVLAARLVQKYCETAPALAESSAHGLDHVRLRRVLDHIAAHIEDDLTLEELANAAGYSPFHFARKFTLAMGISPHRYISRLRLDKAMTQLATGRVALAQIALDANFSSQASFTRAFHRATGMTPKEYQRQRIT